MIINFYLYKNLKNPILSKQNSCWNLLIHFSHNKPSPIGEILFSGGLFRWTSPVNFSSKCLDYNRSRLLKEYFIAFNSSPPHSPFASFIHVLAKHSWPTGGLLHRSVNRPWGWKLMPLDLRQYITNSHVQFEVVQK